jgi:hypothetical protein
MSRKASKQAIAACKAERKLDAHIRIAMYYEVTLQDPDGKPVTGPNGLTTTLHIRNITLDTNGIATLAGLIRESYRTDEQPTLIAAMRRLGRSSNGRGELAKLRVELFGGHPTDPETGLTDFTIMARPGHDLYLWEKAMEAINLGDAPDLFMPAIAAFGQSAPST